MAPKRKPGPSAGVQHKKQRLVPTRQEKVAVLDCLRDGMSVSSVARKYSHSESNIHAIKVRERKICDIVAASAPITAHVTSQVHDKALAKTEKALNLWLEDMNRKRVPTDGVTLRQKALSLYALFKPSAEDGQPVKEFKASHSWLISFRNRFKLENVPTTGEASASADKEAAKAYPKQLKELLDEKGYLPEQVFNAVETGLFWKKMPGRTYISKSEKQAPGFKAANDRVTVLLCGSAAGHLIKPGLLYRSAVPRALKGKNKNLLPVFWQPNKKSWVTAATFLDWFHNCFVPEVKRYLEEKQLDFKVLLIVADAPGHPKALCFAHDDVEVVFLPPNTASIIQPLDQGVIRCFKATYTRLTFSWIRNTMDTDPNLDVIECWKSFNMASCITYIKQAVDAIKPESVNACWRKLWKECVNNFKGFPTIDNEVEHIVQMARQVGGDGFVDLIEEEVEELIDGHGGALTNEELEELLRSCTEDEEEEDEQDEPASWNLHKFAQVFQAAKHLNDLIAEFDPSMERSLKITQGITDSLKPYREMFEQLKRQQRQLPSTMFLTKNAAVASEPTQSTSEAETEPATLPATRNLSPRPGPSSPRATSSPEEDEED
ncbi:tigger transposable element-derived protein 1-like [Zootoca vivipara]|uniref:tigger transposable element-derived protein 1-like n=1 Tax=Zootoca vivipara TaxID=8524 RepID=UPI00293BF8BF|nr:tigger transposable element-derived protein 1-like [Zootoca vivipara]